MKNDGAEAVIESSQGRQRPGVALWSSSRLWVGKGCLAILDQGLISGSNFLMSIFLARWLTAEQYGAYAIGFSVFLVFGSIHGALLVEPLTILGPAFYSDHRRAYLGALILIHFGFALLFALTLGLLAAAAFAFSVPGGVVSALLGLSVSIPFILLHWLLRQAFYLNQAPAPAAVGAGIYSATLLSGAFLAYAYALVSPFTAFLLMGCGGAVTSVFMLLRLKPSWKQTPDGPTLRRVWSEHWGYGRWALGTNAIRLVPENVAYAVTSAFMGMATVGALKALLNLVLPLYQAAGSLYSLFQSHVAGIFGRYGPRATRIPVQKITLLFMAGGLTYAALLIIFRQAVFHFLYADKFIESSYLVPGVAVSGLLAAVALGPALGLRAIQAPSWVFASYCVGDLGTIVFATVLAKFFGLAGIVATFVLCHLTVVVVGTLLFRRKSAMGADALNPSGSH